MYNACKSTLSALFSPVFPFAFKALLMLGLLVCAAAAFAGESGDIFSLNFENDYFGGGTDRHFTNGARFVLTTRPIQWISDAADTLPWFDMERAAAEHKSGKPLQARTTLALGQNIYTPENTKSSELVEDERPYAGWLYGGLGLVANQGRRRYDKLELNIGVVGPDSYSGEVQRGWHRFFNMPEPEGWDHQLKHELGAVLFYEQARRFKSIELGDEFLFDVIPHFGGCLGNVFTYASGGLTMRMGRHIQGDFGPPRIRPSLPGAGFFESSDDVVWYVFLGVEARAVLRNIFLDGNTFRDSHSVDKKYLVADIQAGASFQLKRFRVTYTQIMRTEEYDGQDSPDYFGALSLSYQF